MKPLKDQVWSQVEDQVDGPVGDHVWSQVRAQAWEQKHADTELDHWLALGEHPDERERRIIETNHQSTWPQS